MAWQARRPRGGHFTFCLGCCLAGLRLGGGRKADWASIPTIVLRMPRSGRCRGFACGLPDRRALGASASLEDVSLGAACALNMAFLRDLVYPVDLLSNLSMNRSKPLNKCFLYDKANFFTNGHRCLIP